MGKISLYVGQTDSHLVKGDEYIIDSAAASPESTEYKNYSTFFYGGQINTYNKGAWQFFEYKSGDEFLPAAFCVDTKGADIKPFTTGVGYKLSSSGTGLPGVGTMSDSLKTFWEKYGTYVKYLIYAIIIIVILLIIYNVAVRKKKKNILSFKK